MIKHPIKVLKTIVVTTIISFFIICGFISYHVYFKYPIFIKSAKGTNGLKAELYDSGYLFANIDVVIKRNGKIIEKVNIYSNGDTIIDHDDTTLNWNKNKLTIVEEHRKKKTELTF